MHSFLAGMGVNIWMILCVRASTSGARQQPEVVRFFPRTYTL
jgi:type IV secretory pathway TrbD component